jgi:hypothetical protein
VQLYTDAVPAYYQPTTSAEENRRLLNDRFGTATLPTYAIVKPLGNGQFEIVSLNEAGKINDVSAFAEFLRKPLPAAAGESVARAAGD